MVRQCHLFTIASLQFCDYGHSISPKRKASNLTSATERLVPLLVFLFVRFMTSCRLQTKVEKSGISYFTHRSPDRNCSSSALVERSTMASHPFMWRASNLTTFLMMNLPHLHGFFGALYTFLRRRCDAVLYATVKQLLNFLHIRLNISRYGKISCPSSGVKSHWKDLLKTPNTISIAVQNLFCCV